MENFYSKRSQKKILEMNFKINFYSKERKMLLVFFIKSFYKKISLFLTMLNLNK